MYKDPNTHCHDCWSREYAWTKPLVVDLAQARLWLAMEEKTPIIKKNKAESKIIIDYLLKVHLPMALSNMSPTHQKAFLKKINATPPQSLTPAQIETLTKKYETVQKARQERLGFSKMRHVTDAVTTTGNVEEWRAYLRDREHNDNEVT